MRRRRGVGSGALAGVTTALEAAVAAEGGGGSGTPAAAAVPAASTVPSVATGPGVSAPARRMFMHVTEGVIRGVASPHVKLVTEEAGNGDTDAEAAAHKLLEDDALDHTDLDALSSAPVGIGGQVGEADAWADVAELPSPIRPTAAAATQRPLQSRM